MSEHFVGLLSGTSMDGIDAVLCDFATRPPRIIAARTEHYSPDLRVLLDRMRENPDSLPVADLAELDGLLGDAFANAVIELLAESGLAASDVHAIGSHGQTVLHRPEACPPHTLQIGDPHRIAARTGIRTVADFRRADLAAGGQGAPLAPLIHQVLLASSDENRVVVNLGGIANITVLTDHGDVRGFDTGPANCFVDLWYRQHQAGSFDRNGAWAASGRVDSDWLSTLLDDPYFSRQPPKSTGIEYFNAAWLTSRLPSWAHSRPADIQATLLALSIETLAQAILDLPADQQPAQIIVCGGGVHNAELIRRLKDRLGDRPIASSASFGLDPDFVEAILFAWMARERLTGRPLATPSITGSHQPVLAGVVFEPN